MRFGSRPVEDLVADEDHLLEHRFLRTEHEIQDALVCLVCSLHRFRHRVFDNRSTRLVKFQHDDLPLSLLENDTALVRQLTLSCIKPTDCPRSLDLRQIAARRLK